MALPTVEFQLLTDAQRSNIVNNEWKRPFGLYGSWVKGKYDGLEYTTAIFIDLLRLLFQQSGLGYIYESVPFSNVRVRNSWSDTIETVPDIVVTVGSYKHWVPELNSTGRTDSDLNRYMPEKYEIEMQLLCEGQNKIECDQLTAKTSSFLLEMILPTLANLDIPINSMRNLRVSGTSEKRRSSNFVTQYRVISFPVNLEYIPVQALDKNQVFQGGELVGTQTAI